MNLDLSPTEYLATSRETYERAAAYQQARAQGIRDAQLAAHKRQKYEAQTAAALTRLRGR